MISGSIQQKNGKWHTVIYVPQLDGKKKPVWKTTKLKVKGNKIKAEQILRQRIAEYEAKENLDITDISFADYIYRWLLNKKDVIENITYQGYEQYILKHIKPYFESTKIKLIDIKSDDLQKYINSKYHNGRLDGKGGLSARTLALHRHVLSQALSTAVTERFISDNPCLELKMPKDSKDTAKFDFYSEKELQNLLYDLRDEFLYPAIKMCATYGLRRSELLGLKWGNVSFEAKTFTIAATVVKVTETVYKNKTKNKTSHRTFPMDDEICNMLKRLKEKQDYNRKISGKSYFESDYVFTWDDGHLISPDYISKKFSKLLKMYGYRHIRLHELRHTCACVLLANEQPLKVVQDWLGHSDIKMTANVYGHLDVSAKKNVLGTMQKAIRKK